MAGNKGTTPKAVDLSNGTITVSEKAVTLSGVFINVVLSAHSVAIKNGTDTLFTIPASAAAGNSYDCDNAEFTDNLIVVPNASGTGNITLTFKPMAQG
jgi:hypothetical protein